MQQQETSLAILFADIAGSTKLYDTLGDTIARKKIAQCIEQMTEATKEHGGTLIKVIGDEVMCTFPTADAAAEAALAMQDKVSGALLTGGGSLGIHVGLHFGQVILEEGDVYGDAVNVASRMTNLAKRDQILTTGATIEHLSPKWRKATRQIDRAAVRGKTEQIDVYEFIWQEEDVTRMSGKAWLMPQAGAPQGLLLSWGAHQVEVTEKHPSLTVGRGDQNEIVIRDDMVSRLHARIEYRNGRFSLTDQSTNGSYVTDSAGSIRMVRHDTHVLTGAGTISFGTKPEPGLPHIVKYALNA